MPSGSSTSAGDARMLVASKRVVYVGGLGDDVTQQVLRSAMIPFGNIKSLDIPMDYKIGKTRGFAFVEFDDPDDGTLRSIRFHTQYTVRLPLFFTSSSSCCSYRHYPVLFVFCFFWLMARYQTAQPPNAYSIWI